MFYSKIALFSIILGAMLGGASSAVVKIGIIDIPPLSFSFLRFFIAAICITPFILKGKNNFKSFLSLAPLSFLGSLNIILFVLGIRTTTATIGQLLYAGVPLLSAVFLFLFLKERLGIIRIIGVILGFIGVSIVILLPILEHGQPFSGDLLGNILIGSSVISWSFYMVFSKKALKKYSPFIVTSAFIYTTMVVLFPLFTFESLNNSNWLSSVSSRSLFSLGYISIISTIITYLLNQYAIKHGGSIFASMSFYLLPIFAFFSANILLGEQLTFGILLGGILALIGTFITTTK